MSNVTALPPPASMPQREAALQQARILAMRIMGAAMLPADLIDKANPPMIFLAHRLGAISTLAESLIQTILALQPQPPVNTTNHGEKINA